MKSPGDGKYYNSDGKRIAVENASWKWQDGSGTDWQPCRPEFNPWDPKEGKNWLLKTVLQSLHSGMRLYTYKRNKMIKQMPQWFKLKAWAWHWYVLLVSVSRIYKCLYSKIQKKSSVSMDSDSHKLLYLMHWTQWMMSTVVRQTFSLLQNQQQAWHITLLPLGQHLCNSRPALTTEQAWLNSSSNGSHLQSLHLCYGNHIEQL